MLLPKQERITGINLNQLFTCRSTTPPRIRVRLVSIILLAAIILSGCSSTNHVTLAEYQTEPSTQLPPISVFLKRPADTFRQECETFDNRSILHHCQVNTLSLDKFYAQLKDSGIFTDVRYADSDTGYQLAVSTSAYTTEDGTELGSAVVAGATLMLAPLIVSIDFHVDAGLYWHGHPLHTFTYQIPFQARASLLTMNQDPEKDIAMSIASHILRDIQRKELFSPSFLADKIKASNYSTTLKVPEKTGSYERQFTHVFHHPFRGVQVRYSSAENQVGHADLFVYPIRSPQWDDAEDLLRKEAANVRKDIKLQQSEGSFENPRFGKDQIRTIETGNSNILSAYFDLTYSDTLYNDYISKTYIAIKEDKFIKVRYTTLQGSIDKNNIDAFVSELFDNIHVPPESTFMAKIRKSWRDTSQL